MKTEFDPRKSAANLIKHGVSFAESETVFYDPLGLTNEDDDAQGEARYVTIGLGGAGRILTVVWMYRGENIRLILSAKSDRE